MSSPYAAPVQALIDELGRLPGVGPKSAQRIAFHLLKAAPEDANRLARVIMEAKERVTWCRRCFNIAEGELCGYCLDERRDGTLLCVVEEPRDIVAVDMRLPDRLTVQLSDDAAKAREDLFKDKKPKKKAGDA